MTKLVTSAMKFLRKDMETGQLDFTSEQWIYRKNGQSKKQTQFLNYTNVTELACWHYAVLLQYHQAWEALTGNFEL